MELPLVMAIWKICPALVTGNTLVLKPIEQTPLSTLQLAGVAADLFPPGVFNVVTGHNDTVGAALTSHPRVRMSSLTGDTATGKVVARAGADNLKRLHLGLGGKAPVLVFEDCDTELAHRQDLRGWIRELRPGLHGRLRVLHRRRESTTSSSTELTRAVGKVAMGQPELESTEMGPIDIGTPA